MFFSGGKSLFELKHSSYSYFVNDSINGGLAADFNYPQSESVDFTFNTKWSWYDKQYNDWLYGTGYVRMDEFGLGGTISVFHRYNDFFTPFISIGYLFNWESDWLSDLYLDWDPESGGVLAGSIGLELKLSKLTGRVTHSNYDAGYSAQEIEIHYWYENNRALGFSSSKYSSDFEAMDMTSFNWVFVSN